MRNSDLRQPVQLTNGETEAQNGGGAHTRLQAGVSQGFGGQALLCPPPGIGVRLRRGWWWENSFPHPPSAPLPRALVSDHPGRTAGAALGWGGGAAP